jgi:hypothetical protein
MHAGRAENAHGRGTAVPHLNDREVCRHGEEVLQLACFKALYDLHTGMAAG